MPKFKEFAERAKEFATNTQPCWVYKVHQNILNPRSAEYFWRTREVRFGMPLDQLDREKATPGQWEKAKTHAKILGDMLRENDGPFLMDKTGRFTHQQIQIAVDVYSVLCRFHPGWSLALHEACG
jgi:hypothetical protein